MQLIIVVGWEIVLITYDSVCISWVSFTLGQVIPLCLLRTQQKKRKTCQQSNLLKLMMTHFEANKLMTSSNKGGRLNGLTTVPERKISETSDSSDESLPTEKLNMRLETGKVSCQILWPAASLRSVVTQDIF